MALKQTSILAFPGITEDEYEIYDRQARQDAQTAISTANSANATAGNALNVANGRLKSASLQTNYEDDTKTLNIRLITNTK